LGDIILWLCGYFRCKVWILIVLGEKDCFFVLVLGFRVYALATQFKGKKCCCDQLGLGWW